MFPPRTLARAFTFCVGIVDRGGNETDQSHPTSGHIVTRRPCRCSVRGQVVIAMLITLAGLRVVAGLRPYQREDENNLAEASLWVTFLTL